MVNRFTMNIDVREYLRINPISAHVETTSNNENDCFMWFYMMIQAEINMN